MHQIFNSFTISNVEVDYAKLFIWYSTLLRISDIYGYMIIQLSIFNYYLYGDVIA